MQEALSDFIKLLLSLSVSGNILGLAVFALHPILKRHVSRKFL